jgi:hypothetical protein
MFDLRFRFISNHIFKMISNIYITLDRSIKDVEIKIENMNIFGSLSLIWLIVTYAEDIN